MFEFDLDLIGFYTYCYFFSCLKIFPTQKIRNKTVEVIFAILGASIEHQSDLRVKQIVESKIGFLLESDHYLSD